MASLQGRAGADREEERTTEQERETEMLCQRLGYLTAKK